MDAYPLKFQPVFQKRIWGGQRLRTVLGKAVGRELERKPVGESWELADLPAGAVQADSAGAASDGSLSSRIANGPLAGRTLHEAMKLAEFGAAKGEAYFPLLIKFLDAEQDLSVQVHPDAAYAAKHPGAHLKSEAWYVIYAEPGARIYKGVKAGVTREAFRAALAKGEVEPLLNAIKVRAGDCHYLESGTVHALGAGILAAEVQTPSDTTFRVFDWNRLTVEGKPRKLHVAEALECINFSPVTTRAIPQSATGNERLVSCDYFTLDRVEMGHGQKRALPGELVVWIVLEGQGVISCDVPGPAATTAFARGDTILLPATMKNVVVKTIAKCAWLEAKIPGPAR